MTTSLPGVTIVGGGPGDPDLITVAGLRALEAAEVVLVDRLAPRALLEGLSAEIIDVGKAPHGDAASQEDINRALVAKALEGKRVVRLKGGDGYVFGRGFEEVRACVQAGVPVRVIPGVTSAIAAPALAGIPVTHRGLTHEFVIVSGHLAPSHPGSLVRWDALAQLGGTIVLLMGVENAPVIADTLIRAGRPSDTPTAVIVNASQPSHRAVTTTLGGLAASLVEHQIKPPATIVIGEVVALAG